MLGREAMPPPDVGAALLDRNGEQIGRRRPFDGDRIAPDRCLFAEIGDGELLAVDARLEQPVDRIHEVVDVKLRVKSEDRAAEQSVE